MTTVAARGPGDDHRRTDLGAPRLPLRGRRARHAAVCPAPRRCGPARAARDARDAQATVGVPAFALAADARGVAGESQTGAARLPRRGAARPATETGDAPRVVRPGPQRPAERWSIDFVHDALGTGRVFRALTIVDDFTRYCPAIVVDHGLSGERVIATLEQLAVEWPLPPTIVCDNGREYEPGVGSVGVRARDHAAVYSAGEAGREYLRRELQRPAAG